MARQPSKQERPRGVELQYDENGKKNGKYVDLLDVDKSIAGQNFVCISFVSPEKIVKQKEMFMFEQFLKGWGLNKSLEKFTQFLHFVSFKYHINFDDLASDLQEFAKEERGKLFGEFTIEDEYKNFLDDNEEKLEKEFDESVQFQTSTRGIKVRGVFPSQEEAELRCKMLREQDPNHEIYVGPVGTWMPWHPEAYKTGRVEYLEDELNQLMHEKQKNEKKAKEAFDERVKEARRKAIQENEKKALESGNVLTQTLNENGELVSVSDVNTTEARLQGLGSEVSSADIRRELFEGENVVLPNSRRENNE
jgi:hypothetical protein